MRYLLDTIRTLSADLERMERVAEDLKGKMAGVLEENDRNDAARFKLQRVLELLNRRVEICKGGLRS